MYAIELNGTVLIAVIAIGGLFLLLIIVICILFCHCHYHQKLKQEFELAKLDKSSKQQLQVMNSIVTSKSLSSRQLSNLSVSMQNANVNLQHNLSVTPDSPRSPVGLVNNTNNDNNNKKKNNADEFVFVATKTTQDSGVDHDHAIDHDIDHGHEGSSGEELFHENDNQIDSNYNLETEGNGISTQPTQPAQDS